MNILIDIGHPAHVHMFKHCAIDLLSKGHNVLFTCREKEFEIELLKTYSFNFKSFGKKYNSGIGKIIGLIEFDAKELLAGIKFKPDMFLSHGSIYAAHAAFLLGKPHISLEDTFNFEQIRLYLPFTKIVLSGEYDHPDLGPKEIQYAGYHELAYLHPKYFTPTKDVLKLLNVQKEEKYVILRFVAWNATHDFGHKGISLQNKLIAIKKFEKYAKVFISSESEIPEEIKKHKINIPPDKMHDVLAYASLLWAESFTMASECSVLGIPSIINHNTKSFYLFEQEKRYGLCYNFTESEEDQQKAIEKGIEILKLPNLNEEWQKKRQKLLQDKIDVTAFLVWFIEFYPESVTIMKSNPEYSYTFK